MFGVARDKYTPLIDRDTGDRTYPIWLLINPKYPVVVTDIWKHVLNEIQDRVYRAIHARIDTSNIYIRSVVGDCEVVPNTLNWWGNDVAAEMELFRGILLEHHPKLLISFGAFPYEFIRRVFEIIPEKGPKYWGTSILKDEFEKSLINFDINQTNMVPLLRRVVASNKVEGTHNHLTGNEREQYFQHVGAKIAEVILQNKDILNIWIK